MGARRREEVLDALADGQVIAVPGDGGYKLAVRHDHPDALAMVRARRSSAVEDAPFHMVVGRRAQAIELASFWSKETRFLTDRMWPGPLTVIVPAHHDVPDSQGSEESVVHITMPATRALRELCRESGPLAVIALRRADGHPIVTPDDVEARFTDSDIALVVDGGICRGPGPTVVDCTVSPPTVRHVGALPESYVDAALMMGNRRRKWLTKRTESDAEPR